MYCFSIFINLNDQTILDSTCKEFSCYVYVMAAINLGIFKNVIIYMYMTQYLACIYITLHFWTYHHNCEYRRGGTCTMYIIKLL